MCAGLLQVACTFVCFNNFRPATVRENWYKEIGSLLAQALQKKRQRNIKSNLLNYPKTQLNTETLKSIFPSMVTNSVVGKNTLRTSKLGLDLHANFNRKEMTF